ncbi:ubiquitin-like domain-containing protein [Myceligenerans crystallogenes]|uniref:aggregation-promoting factor C-terminal-like domain-containing protein n=1 Tax=Myceligenerans crystallogenes TaxID=316335 RepID=UPI0031D9BE1E
MRSRRELGAARFADPRTAAPRKATGSAGGPWSAEKPRQTNGSLPGGPQAPGIDAPGTPGTPAGVSRAFGAEGVAPAVPAPPSPRPPSAPQRPGAIQPSSGPQPAVGLQPSSGPQPATGLRPASGAQPEVPRPDGAKRRKGAHTAPPEPLSFKPPEWLAKAPVRVTAQAAVLGSLVAVTGTYAAQAKTVTIDYNGELKTVDAYGTTVAEILKSQHITPGRADVVTPAVDADAKDGSVIVVRSMRTVDIEIDGERTQMETTAGTVGELLALIGERGQGAVASASRSEPLGREPIRVSTMKTVHVSVDGRTMPVKSTQPTVGGMLAEAGIVLKDKDVSSVPLGAAAVDGMVVMINRNASSQTTVTETIPFETKTIEDPNLLEGEEVVQTAGVAGEAQIRYAVTELGGAVVEREVLERKILSEPVTQVVAIGTMQIATAQADPDSARALGQSMAAERGWTGEEWECLDALWTRESGWRWNADNPSSSAYGIPQALPGSKMATHGSDWLTNPATQISWGFEYIAGRYGSPCGAWAHSESVGWY